MLFPLFVPTTFPLNSSLMNKTRMTLVQKSLTERDPSLIFWIDSKENGNFDNSSGDDATDEHNRTVMVSVKMLLYLKMLLSVNEMTIRVENTSKMEL